MAEKKPRAAAQPTRSLQITLGGTFPTVQFGNRRAEFAVGLNAVPLDQYEDTFYRLYDELRVRVDYAGWFSQKNGRLPTARELRAGIASLSQPVVQTDDDDDE